MNGQDLNEQEKKAIKALERVAKIWPDTIALFASGGTLSVRKVQPDGSFFAQHEITAIPGIKNDGGDGGDEY